MPHRELTDVEVEINRLLDGVRHSATSTSKYNRLTSYISEIARLPRKSIYATYLGKPSYVSVRVEQSSQAQQADLVIGVVAKPEDLESDKDKLRNIAQRGGRGTSFLLLSLDDSERWRVVWGLQPSHRDWLVELVQDDQLEIDVYESSSASETTLSGARSTTSRNIRPISVPLILDERIERMFRAAVASHHAVMLIGPPGTGKSTLVQNMVETLLVDPSAYGMTQPHELLTVTADESWTTRELVGGDSVDDDGHLRFTPGYVLQAIRDDKWLLLDEANRADLDRIFGGLLTWLSGQQVTVGRYSPTNPAEIVLGWADSPDSEPVSDEEPDSSLHYAAGTEWRLIGTYNSVDAHRVFRLGLALGRRFAQIPIPPPNAAQFGEIIGQHVDGWELPGLDQLKSIVTRIYEIHGSQNGAALGPAPFLAIPPYVRAAANLGTTEVRELIAEAYLSAFGTWLARMDLPILDRIGVELASDEVLGSQWQWVRTHLANLA